MLSINPEKATGTFYVKDVKNGNSRFYYLINNDPYREVPLKNVGDLTWGVDLGATHLVEVNDIHGWKYRYAKVHKTFVEVMTATDDFDSPLWEKWKIKNHKVWVH